MRLKDEKYRPVKGELINMTQAMGQRKNLRNQTHDLPNTWRALYPLSYKNSWRAKSFHVTHHEL